MVEDYSWLKNGLMNFSSKRSPHSPIPFLPLYLFDFFQVLYILSHVSWTKKISKQKLILSLLMNLYSDLHFWIYPSLSVHLHTSLKPISFFTSKLICSDMDLFFIVLQYSKVSDNCLS